MKPKTVYIIAIIISILLLGICSGSLYLFTKKNERFLEKQKSNQLEKDSIDNILRISRMLENNKFTELFKELEGKSDNDSIYYRPKESYISVEEITKIAKEKQAEIRKENERIDRETIGKTSADLKDKKLDIIKEELGKLKPNEWANQDISKLLDPLGSNINEMREGAKDTLKKYSKGGQREVTKNMKGKNYAAGKGAGIWD